MTEGTCAVVHLVRASNGPEVVRTFLQAYRRTIGEEPHRLVFACKGFDNGLPQESWRKLWADFDVTELVLPDRGLDLGSYLRASTQLDEPVLCFLNSFSRPRVSGWLGLLRAALNQAPVGLAGATASWESLSDVRQHSLRKRAARRFLPGYSLPRSGFPAFPNPHLRTNAFIISRELLLELDLPEPQVKDDAWLIESGPHSLTRQVLDRGLRVVVVDAQGRARDVAMARDSNTFRWGDQRGLLVEDNATDAYMAAAPSRRRHLERLAWGQRESKPV